jgi:hypothetical protein
MATLTANAQRLGTNYKNAAFVSTGSVFAVGTTTVFIREANGTLRSWQNGRASFLNTLPGTNKDEIPAYTAFQVLPSQEIITDDSLLSFGTTIATGGGTTVNANGFIL